MHVDYTQQPPQDWMVTNLRVYERGGTRVSVCVCVCVCVEERGAAFKGMWTQSVGLLSKFHIPSVVEVVTENRQVEDEEADMSGLET